MIHALKGRLSNPLAWPLVRMHADSFPDWHVEGGSTKKTRQLTMLLRPSAAPTTKTTKRRPSVHVLLNSTCTDDRQFYD